MPPVEEPLGPDSCGRKNVLEVTGLKSVFDVSVLIKLTAGFEVVLGSDL